MKMEREGAAVRELTTEMCAFPGCERPVAPAPEGAGRPSRYCEQPEHNAQSAFRERRRRAGAGELDGSEGAEQGRGDRPVSLAGATLRAVAARLVADLERTRDALGVLTDTEQLEAELAAVRADTQAEVSHAAQHEAAARRERMEADEAAESALRAAAEAEERARAASEREREAEARGGDAQVRAEEAERAAQDALARADAAAAAQSAAEVAATRAGEQAQEALARAELAEKDRAAELARARCRAGARAGA
jgi:colicin import membrane protein